MVVARGHRGGVTGLAYSPGQQQVVSCSEDCTLIVWEVGAAAQGGEEQGEEEGVEEKPDEERALLLHRLQGAHSRGLLCCAWSECARWIVSAGREGCVGVWDAWSMQLASLHVVHHDWVTSVAWIPPLSSSSSSPPSCLRLVTSSWDLSVKIWEQDAAEGSLGEDPALCLEGHVSPVSCAAASPDGTRVVCYATPA